MEGGIWGQIEWLYGCNGNAKFEWSAWHGGKFQFWVLVAYQLLCRYYLVVAMHSAGFLISFSLLGWVALGT